ncbi:MAG: DUF5682 family protein, partial [Saprospiraceae bacterium]|nr:DUF5682 family protein [Saprospiraceae bacterium]
MKVHFFGIRHHGPGSSKSLQKALEATEPDAILIENPLEMDAMLAYMTNPELKPPVAVLIYNPKDLKQAAYYPYTSYSPEWHAIQYGLSKNVPIVSMDLPQSLRFGLAEREENLRNTQDLFSHLSGERTHSQDEEEQDEIIRDPLGYMARLAGYEDSERWWEITFEQTAKDVSIFEAIQELMTALRTELRIPESVLGRCREAYMRKILRKAMKTYKNIAVVCGAWHVPALANWKLFKVKDDNSILKGIPRVKTEATWIPWTYERISISSGYGAGVVSPAWYHLLYHEPEAAVIKWMAKVANLLRKEDLEASSAHVIEAVRLAETLATLRG